MSMRRRPLDHVAGYCVVNDLSERHFQQERGGQRGPGQVGRHLRPDRPVAGDDRRDQGPAEPQHVPRVDGHRYQNGNTKTMIFGVKTLVSYISQFMSLQPGDVISTGTRRASAWGSKPNPVWLKPGQTMRLGIEGLGEQQQRTKAYAA